MPSVLFVCTANMCRSPMAMALFKTRVAQSDDLSQWRIESAGTWALEGEPAARRAQTVLADEFGLDLSRHSSRAVTRELLRSFSLILAMEQGHKEALLAEFPEIAGRVYLLSEMAGIAHDIRDPMGGALADFQDTAHEIDRLLARGFEKICALA